VLDHTAEEGGAELAMLRVAQVLHGDRADIRVLLFADGPLFQRLRAAGVPTVVLPLDESVAKASRDQVVAGLARSAGAALGYLPRLVRAIRGADVDLVVANSLKSAAFAAFAAPLAGRRWVWHLHDRLSADYLPLPLRYAMRAVAAWGPRAIVVNSRATLATLPPRARRKATIAYPGLTPDAFDPAEPASPPIVGIIGRISPTKGQLLFIEAAAAIAGEHPDVRFRVIGAALFGEDAYEAEVRRLATRLGIADRTEFTGWVSDAPAWLRRLAVLVHASPTPEPFGQVIVEAMAAGVPVVATSAGGVPEILDPSGGTERLDEPWTATATGVLVRPGDVSALADAMRAVLGETDTRALRSAAARADALHRFTIERTADVVAAAWTKTARRPRNSIG
jgi:glycosyltransferase involved in cell wall biosynthesis